MCAVLCCCDVIVVFVLVVMFCFVSLLCFGLCVVCVVLWCVVL